MSDFQWFYADSNGQQQGPVDRSFLHDAVNRGLLGLTSLVWREGLAEWVPLSSVGNDVGLVAPALAQPPLPAPGPSYSAGPRPPQGSYTGSSRSVVGASEENLQAFVADNYHFFKRKWEIAAASTHHLSWNWVAFFFGVIWLVYRKMYRYAVILFSVYIVLTIIEEYLEFPEGLSNVLDFSLALAVGFYGNHYYRLHAEQKIREIGTAISPDRLQAELARRGGTNIGAALGVAAVLLVLVVIGVVAALADA